jgi:nitric oxide reductase large subunit
MNLDRYEYSTNEFFLDFEFYSEGPNGKIKKVITFNPYNSNGVTYFNIAFGDWNEEGKKIDDQTVSNNQDRAKILATVASAILDFTNNFPDLMVYAEGSTPARTRLYQMGITLNWAEIHPLLFVYGFVNDHWQPFEKNVNYQAFLVIRKKT